MLSRTVVTDPRRPDRRTLLLAAISFVSLLSMPLSAGCPDFAGPVPYTSGGLPLSVAAGDFNGDGRVDVAAVNGSTGNVSILLGTGTGDFFQPLTTAPSFNENVVAADFDRDGKLDLVVANSIFDSVALMKGNGNGTFQSPTSYIVHSRPDSMLAADFNRDGKLDLAVVDTGSNDVALLLGDGAGGFAAAAFFAVGNGPRAFAAGDFNRDGSLDLITANLLANSVSLLAGNGSGSFAAAVSFAVPQTPGANGPISITAGDWNGDGKADFAAANQTSQTVSVFLGNGAGGFASPSTIAVGGDPKVISSGDFNGDGIADLAVANFAGGTLSVLKGDGAGGFVTAGTFNAGPQPTALALADVDGDSKPDLLVANRSGTTVAIVMNTGTCLVNCSTFSGSVNYPVNGPASVAIGDFNRDGRSDFASVGNLGTVYIYLAGTPGAFALQNSYDLAASGRSLAAADYDADGILDLAVATSAGVSILRGNGSGAFTVSTVPISSLDLPSPSPSFIAAGDFNRDGKQDLAVADDARDSVWVLLATTPGSFADAVSYTAGSAPKSIAIADVDRNGLADLVVANSASSSVSILLGGTAGTFSLSPATPGGGFASSVATGDFNGDGNADIASANSGASSITILTGNGSGGFTALPAFASTTPAAIVVADFNLDGKLDLAVANESVNSATVRLGDGSGGFSGVVASAGNGLGPRSLAAGDLDGDGKPDLAIGNQASQNVSIARNSCPRPDLSITKVHSGNFTQRQTGRVYTINVSNGGAGPTAGVVTVTDALPAGLTATSLSGTGWNCSLGTLTCSRSDVLPPPGNYSAITLVVSVSSTAPTLVTNVATVSGGGDLTPGNNSASDPATVIANPDLTIAKSHSGSFVQGQTFRTYTLTVSNVAASPGPSSGTVTVVESLPSGLTLVSLGGTGWTCLPSLRTCTRTDALAGAASYPPILVTVNVDGNAPATVSNTATVAGGGEFNTANNSVTDVTTIAPAPATCGTFGPAANYALATGVRDVVVGDFNGDGKADLAATTISFGSAFIYAGNGDGSFAAATSYALGGNVSSLSVADMNGDGRLDLLATNANANSVSIGYGNGDGTFASQIPWFAGVQPNSASVADFNGDGRLDYATANLGSDSISIVLANTSGGFVAPVDYPTDPSPMAIAAADFNGDGKVDLAAATSFNSVAILLGVGDGTFGPRTNVPVHSDARSIAVADFNGDGRTDLAVAFLGGGEVGVLPGVGNGTFGAASYYATGGGTFSVAPVDVDHDFKTDLAVSVNGSIVVLPGIGNGTFGTAVSYPTAAGVGTVRAGDFNGDGRADLVAGRDPGTGGTVSVLINACADLSLVKSHGGNFTQGQNGAAFTLTVNNSGQLSWARSVTVTDAVPAGFVATGISGSGWNCSLATVSCTRSDLLAAASAYPPVTVTVAVNSDAPGTVVNSATLSAPGDPNAANNTATDPATINPSGLIAPTNLVASAASTSSVTIVWNGVTTAVSYDVYRKSGGAAFGPPVQTVLVPAWTDSGLAANTSYVYQVVARDAGSALSPPSNPDVATTIVFTDDPLLAGTTPVKAVHLTELRTAVNAVRAAAGLGPVTFIDPVPAGVPIRAVHVTELRSNLEPARSALGLPTIAWTDPSLGTGVSVKAAHTQQVRMGTK